MTVIPSRRVTIRNFAPLLVALASLVPLCTGCSDSRVHAEAPTATPAPSDVHPMTIAPDTDASPPLTAESAPPEIPSPSTNETVNLAPSPVAPPPRTRPAAPSQSDENGQDTAKPQPPRIAPQLSAGDTAAYQRRTEDDSNTANRNLQSITGHQLNATQQDLADKVRSFLAQATDASKDGDWARAQNLAQKARVLSVELINSL